jgi:hypothetical protein
MVERLPLAVVQLCSRVALFRHINLSRKDVCWFGSSMLGHSLVAACIPRQLTWLIVCWQVFWSAAARPSLIVPACCKCAE